MGAPMDSLCFPPSRLPHSTKLFIAYLEDFSRVKHFYPRAPELAAAIDDARSIPRQSSPRSKACRVLRRQNEALGAGPKVSRSLDALESGAVAVVTGQQVGLFTGPSYSLYKALTAVRVARELSKAGVPAVPVFWLATEDHDLAEVSHCSWFSGHSLLRFGLNPPGSEGRPVGAVPLGPEVSSLVELAANALEGEAARDIEADLRECYGPRESFGSAFGRLLSRLFRDEGLIVLDPMDQDLHGLAADTYRRALVDHQELAAALLRRNRELENAGFHAQVKVSEQSTLLFLVEQGRRLPLRVRNGRFTAGEAVYVESDLLKRLEADPQAFSANALLRSVVQDSILPTAAYIAGPAEIVYFAQSSVLYEHLSVKMPVVLPRASFTLVEPPARKLLVRYGLKIEDVWAGRQHLRRRMEAQHLPKSLSTTFDRTEKELSRSLAKLEKRLATLDRTLVGAAATAGRKMSYQLDKLRRKAGRAHDFRKGVLDSHEQLLLDSLYPDRALQERSHCLLPYLARHGLSLLEELQRRMHLESFQHQALFLD